MPGHPRHRIFRQRREHDPCVLAPGRLPSTCRNGCASASSSSRYVSTRAAHAIQAPADVSNQIERRCVGPVQVFEHEQRGRLAQPIEKCWEKAVVRLACVQCLAQRRRELLSEIDERPERSWGEHRIAAGDQCAYLGVMLARESTDHSALADAGFAGDKDAAPVALPSVRDCCVQCCERVLALSSSASVASARVQQARRQGHPVIFAFQQLRRSSPYPLAPDTDCRPRGRPDESQHSVSSQTKTTRIRLALRATRGRRRFVLASPTKGQAQCSSATIVTFEALRNWCELTNRKPRQTCIGQMLGRPVG